jgi:RND family efflux transporter MFP subunit
VASSGDEQLQERFDDYRTATSMNSCLLVRLREASEESQGGVLGVLALESRESRLYGPADMGIVGLSAKVLSAALERARQYARLPAIGLLEGVSKLRRRPSSRVRLIRWGIILAAVISILVFVQMPFTAGGVCEIVPKHRAVVTSRVAGRIQEVMVRENVRVSEGDPLIRLDDSDFQLRLASQNSQLDASLKRQAAFMAQGDMPSYREEEATYRGLLASKKLLEEQLSRTLVTAPVDGVVITPNMEDLVGRTVDVGTPFCEVASIDRLELEVAVPEEFIGSVREGQPVTFMLSTFPGQDRAATVTHIRLRSQPKEKQNTFGTICDLTDADAALRPGMTGWARVSTGKRAVGYVLFRKVIVWAQMKLMF